MKGANEIEINRTRPVFVKNGCNYVEAINRIGYRFFYDGKIGP